MPISTRVLVPLGKGWTYVGRAALHIDEKTGARMLCLDLAAMAPRLYVPLDEVLALAQDPAGLLDVLLAQTPAAAA